MARGCTLTRPGAWDLRIVPERQHTHPAKPATVEKFWSEKFPAFSRETRDQIHITEHTRGGKLAGLGICSINTSPWLNEFCMCHCPNRHICYAKNQLQTYGSDMNEALISNWNLLTGPALEEDQIPIIPYRLTRQHALGELSPAMPGNLSALYEANPQTKVTVFSHRPDLCRKIDDLDNVRFVISIDESEIGYGLEGLLEDDRVSCVFATVANRDQYIGLGHHCVTDCKHCGAHCYKWEIREAARRKWEKLVIMQIY